MITSLATQEDLTTFKRALESLSANLDYHVNSSLSLAHGIALMHGPSNDGAGNDLRLFTDAKGHAVSSSNTGLPNHIRFIIGGVPYYAPCNYTDPGAQSSSTGAVVLTPLVSDRPTNTALVTSYVSYEAIAAASANAELLKHIGTSHQQAHVPMTVVPAVTQAPDGDAYASHLVYIQFENKVYAIPVHTRLGGPGVASTYGISAAFYEGDGLNGRWELAGDTLYMIEGSNGHRYKKVSLTSTLAGTKPIAYAWEWSDTGEAPWSAVDLNTPFGTGTLQFSCSQNPSGTTGSSSVTTTFDIPQAGGNETANTYLRLKLDNSSAGGSLVYSNPIWFQLSYSD